MSFITIRIWVIKRAASSASSLGDGPMRSPFGDLPGGLSTGGEEAIITCGGGPVNIR